MTPVTLQIALPEKLELTPEELVTITGRKPTRLQMAWLDEHGWEYSLDMDKGVVVGKLYAHLRLAGLHPAHLLTPVDVGGFALDRTR